MAGEGPGFRNLRRPMSHPDLEARRRARMRARRVRERRWFCYPSGHYDAAVIAAVRGAGFLGSTTTVPGWASRADDPYRLPRLRVLGGTSPGELLAQIAASQSSA